jgi:hypothetical protein
MDDGGIYSINTSTFVISNEACMIRGFHSSERFILRYATSYGTWVSTTDYPEYIVVTSHTLQTFCKVWYPNNTLILHMIKVTFSSLYIL